MFINDPDGNDPAQELPWLPLVCWHSQSSMTTPYFTLSTSLSLFICLPLSSQTLSPLQLPFDPPSRPLFILPPQPNPFLTAHLNHSSSRPSFANSVNNTKIQINSLYLWDSLCKLRHTMHSLGISVFSSIKWD